ncbi:hypothetical protein [Hymenobacter jeollabukensis]|uniref:Uncharacterized protein n=1 Tax=Hymenobacter jeollabukensis TaxID=2025313 RepID=A0A5R8WI84_9BACT|nr:hypothetical protein [Hymenobacter jeollabukensis]TLM88344.1 hypothetical protein FDY95_24505 [Hymenobacter jeollabukensis]
MNKASQLLLATLVLGSCAARQSKPVVPLAEAKVKTAAEAQAIALRWIAQDSSEVRHLRLDQVEVQEQPAGWEVFIRRNDNRKPGGTLIVVDKRTGKPTNVPLK